MRPCSTYMMVAAILVIIMTLGVVLAGAQSPSVTELLERELGLAAGKQIYFIIHLDSKAVQLKARGMTLRVFSLTNVSLHGESPASDVYRLIAKTSLFSPKREKIKVEDSDKPAAGLDLQALELDDMPSGYRLQFERGMTIHVRSSGKKILPALVRASYAMKFHTLSPFKKVWNSLRKRPYTEIYMTMNEEDAKALYWSFAEGTGSIVYPPVR